MALTKLIFPPYLSDEAYKARQISFQPMTRDIDHNSAESAIKDRGDNKSNFGMPNTQAGETILGFQVDGIIVLPLPGEISDSQSHSWNEEEGVVSKATDKIFKTLSDKYAKKDTLFGKAMSELTGNIEYANSYAWHKLGLRKELTDPGMFQSYKGSNPRSFSLSFTLIPNNADEAELIRQIIIAFKKYSSPSISINNVSMSAPYYWHVTFENPAINSMFRMDCVVITNVGVDYGDGDMQLFVDGFPKMIKLNLSLQEARLTYADNYEDVGFSETSFNRGSAVSSVANEEAQAAKKRLQDAKKALRDQKSKNS